MVAENPLYKELVPSPIPLTVATAAMFLLSFQSTIQLELDLICK